MEIGFDISRIQFSCIRISLTNMSKQSQMMLLKKCRESPKFLEKWIQSMISEKHIQRLQEKNIDKISFQVKLCLPDLDKSNYMLLFISSYIFEFSLVSVHFSRVQMVL
jgi:hypothetical protein